MGYRGPGARAGQEGFLEEEELLAWALGNNDDEE